MKIYLIINDVEKDKEINEINLIYYVKPDFDNYKEIEEKDLPIEKEGFRRKLFYNKNKDEVYAEYEKIETEKTVDEKINDVKKEIKSTANNIMEAVIKMNMTANKKMTAEDVPPLESLNDLGIPQGDIDISNLGDINIDDIPKLDPSEIPPPPVIN